MNIDFENLPESCLTPFLLHLKQNPDITVSEVKGAFETYYNFEDIEEAGRTFAAQMRIYYTGIVPVRYCTDGIKVGRYRHYKGNHYQVMGEARHVDTDESMVIYKGDDGRLWARSRKEFVEEVKQGKLWVPRFLYIGESCQIPQAI